MADFPTIKPAFMVQVSSFILASKSSHMTFYRSISMHHSQLVRKSCI